mmetsp:Transcript_118651/g.206617  ORF Transcript_118651/g.206617 Transcript_118651/m.206617 type:complete len:276 (-) Transcript_118651:933-1760(-)
MPMACSVFTFGFGRDHDSEMLREVADAGKGMYYFVETPESIAESFADCLGGLVSVVAQKVVLTAVTMPGVTISGLSTAYPQELSTDGTRASVTMPDLYSEEQRDVLLTLQLPATLPDPKPGVILNWELRYSNVITDRPESAQASVQICRPQEAGPQPPAPPAIDRQLNRLRCTSAMKKSKQLADSGQLSQARAELEAAMTDIRITSTGASEYCVALADDLQDCFEQMEDEQAWDRKGKHFMNQASECHEKQRCSGMKGRYINKSKAAFVSLSKGG